MGYFSSIRYLREIAALMVVVFHVGLFFPGWRFDTGAGGVDIFFVISGFVMFSSGRSLSPAEFLRHRIIRIVPLYWTVTLVVLFWYGWGSHTSMDLIRSLLFIAFENPGAQPSVSPILTVGWTLNLEMMFYLLFALFLAIGRRHLVLMMAVLMCALAVAGKTLPGLGPVTQFYMSGIVVEFAIGLVIAQGIFRGWLRLPPFVGLALVVAGVVLLAYPVLETLRVIQFGLPASLIVLGAISLDPLLPRDGVRWLALLGDSSYALYLTHILTIVMLNSLARHLELEKGIALAIVIIVLCHVPAILLHLYFEKPVTNALRRMFQPKRLIRN